MSSNRESILGSVKRGFMISDRLSLDRCWPTLSPLGAEGVCGACRGSVSTIPVSVFLCQGAAHARSLCRFFPSLRSQALLIESQAPWVAMRAATRTSSPTVSVDAVVPHFDLGLGPLHVSTPRALQLDRSDAL